MTDRLSLIRSDDPYHKTFPGLLSQFRVISALMLRDAVSRFGHEGIGFFWVVGEPMLLTAGVMLMWTLAGTTHGNGDIGVVPFALTGYSYITLWRHIVSRAVRGLTRNSSLLYLNQVLGFDIIFAGCLLETVAILTAFTVVYLPLALLGYVPIAHDPLLSLAGYFLMAWFAFGFGLIILAISELSETADRFIQPLMYITIPATGIFTMMDWLPAKAQEVLIWSPLVSGIEMVRGGIFPEDQPVHYDVLFLAESAFVLTAIGLPAVLYAQRHVQV